MHLNAKPTDNWSMPKVSVVIPTHNRAFTLERSIRSALNQTISDLEVIIVDDCSSDETEHIVTGIKDSRLRYLHQDRRQGACKARNTGLRAARGSYVGFLDSDDEWFPRKIEKQLELLHSSRSPRADVATCGIVWAESGQVALPRRERLSFDGLLSFRDGPWGGPTIFIRRTETTAVVEWDASLPSGQDWDYLIQLAGVTGVVSVREPLVRIHRANGEHIGSLQRKLNGRRALRRKYDEQLKRKPIALAAHEAGLAQFNLLNGDRTEARQHFLNAWAARPWGTRETVQTTIWFLRMSAASAIMKMQNPQHGSTKD